MFQYTLKMIVNKLKKTFFITLLFTQTPSPDIIKEGTLKQIPFVIKKNKIKRKRKENV